MRTSTRLPTWVTSIAQLREQPLGFVGIAVPDALDRFDLDLVVAAGRDADVAGNLRQVERAVGADLVGPAEPFGLLGALPRFLIALEPGLRGCLFGARRPG